MYCCQSDAWFRPPEDEGMAYKRENVPVKARISRIRRFGLYEVVRLKSKKRAAFTLDKVIGYGGQPPREFGIKKGAEVELFEDGTGRVDHVKLLSAATVS